MQTLNFESFVDDSVEDENLPVQCHPVTKPKKKKTDEVKNDTV